MGDRLKSMQRIVKVRETMRRQAEWKLADCERRAAELRATQDRLSAFLNAGDMSGGRLMETLGRSARSLSERIAVADQTRADQARRVLEETRKIRLAERCRDDLAEDARREQEKRELAEWIERAAAKPAS